MNAHDKVSKQFGGKRPNILIISWRMVWNSNITTPLPPPAHRAAPRFIPGNIRHYQNAVRDKLARSHSEAQPLVGRDFDNPRFYVGQVGNPDNVTTTRGIPDEFECYNLKEDPLEVENRMSPICPQPLPEAVHKALEQALEHQRKIKRLLPKTLNDQGDAGANTPMQN